MAKPVFMPRVGQSVESSILSTWYKKVGDDVKIGDRLFTFETDKATFDEEAKDSGILLARFYEEGDDIPCMTNVCVIGKEGESFAEFAPQDKNAEQQNDAVSVPAETEQTVQREQEEVVSASISGDIHISPRAKTLAQKNNLEYRLAQPTGAEGRIIERDVLELLKAGVKYTNAALKTAQGGDPISGISGSGIGGRITIGDIASASAFAASTNQNAGAKENYVFEDVKVSNIRKVIAKSMQQSLANTAQLTHHLSFDATQIEQLRQQIKANSETSGMEKITINDIILYAVSRTLPAHKTLNAHFIDDKMRYFKDVHLGIAVDTDRGLMVPTIFNANKLSLNDIAKKSKELVQMCRNGSISPDLLTGATFTVSNLGSFGIEIFTPIINPPQTGILGVCNIIRKPREKKDGGIEFYSSMGLSMTYDHRAIDGAPASRFLQDLAKNLESFPLLLLK